MHTIDRYHNRVEQYSGKYQWPGYMRLECCVPSGLDFEVSGGSIVRYYHTSNSRECMGVNGEALQLHAVYKKAYFLLQVT